MSIQNHPWVQDYASFEAVLCNAHEGGHWDESATLRAYQTFGFDDASTPGNDQTFRHIDTGVLLLHDGDVVAIQFGDGNLPAALSDLFLVLGALGWTEAVVYHPAESLGALLNDMGKAIPGHMQFDVRAAKAEPNSMQSPEAAALIERGKSLLQGVAVGQKETQEFNSLALGELESMAPDLDAGADARITSQPFEQGTQFVPAAGPVHLDQDPVISDRGREPDHPLHASAHSNGVQPRGQVFLDDADGAPMVPVLHANTSNTAAGTTWSSTGRAVDGVTEQVFSVEHDLVTEEAADLVVNRDMSNASVSYAEYAGLNVAEELEPAQRVPVPNVERPMHEVPATVSLQNADESLKDQMLGNSDAKAGHGAVSVIRVGNSALSFDTPNAAVSLADADRVADLIGATEVVHLWPGMINQPERWDLIGEIDPSAPWFAELIANELEVQSPIERTWFAAALLQMARRQSIAQLRDLLDEMMTGAWSEQCGALAQSAAFKPRDHEHFVHSVLGRFSALLLSENGESFLDIRPAVQSATDESAQMRVFNVRSMLLAPESKLYVVHLDAIDGPFVEMVVNLLKVVASRYAISTRMHKRVEAAQHEVKRRETTLREAQRKETLETVQKTVVGLMEQLKKVGFTLPT